MFAHLAIAAFPAALFVAACNDLYEFKIPNWISILLAFAFPVAALSVGASLEMIAGAMALGFGALVVGFALFAGKIVGGGDAKLFAAIAPWIGFDQFPIFLFYTALSGLVLAMGLGLFRKTPILPVYAHAPWIVSLHERKKDLPYAVALGAGAMITFPQTPIFQFAFGG